MALNSVTLNNAVHVAGQAAGGTPQKSEGGEGGKENDPQRPQRQVGEMQRRMAAAAEWQGT